MEKKNSLQGSPNLPIIETGDHSDPAEPLEERDDPGKQEGYNLRNMFKQVGPTNGAVTVEAKRKKSVTLLVPYKSGEPMATEKPPEPAAAMMEVVLDDDEGAEDRPDSAERLESSVPLPEEGTDTDVPTDSEMAAGDKAPGSAEGARAAEEEEEEAAAEAPKKPVPPVRVREFSVVRMGEPPEEGAVPGEYGRDDMVEMEDIKDCRVSQEEDGRPSREEKRRSVHTQHKW